MVRSDRSPVHAPGPKLGSVLLLGALLLSPVATDRAHAQPANDDCSTAEAIPSLPFVISITTPPGASATGISGCTISNDLWYSLEVTAEQDLLVQSAGSAPNTVSVYVVPGGSVGVCPAPADRVLCAVTEEVVSVLPGDLVFFQLFDPAAAGSTLLSVRAIPDRCETAETIPGLPYDELVLLDFFSATPGFPGCPAVADAWFVYAPPSDDVLVLDTGPNNVVGDITVFAVPSPSAGACPPEAAIVACGVTSLVLPVVAGTDYWFRVGLPAPTTFVPTCRIRLDTLDPVTNDECDTPMQLAIPETRMVEFIGATDSAAPGACAVEEDLWFTIDPPDTNPVEIIGPTSGSITVYENSTPCPGVVVACGFGTCTFAPIAGTQYLVQVGAPFAGVIETVETRFVNLSGIDDRYRYRVPSVPIPLGAPFPVPVEFSSTTTGLGPPESVAAVSVAVCIDPTEAALVAADLGSDMLTIQAGSPPDYWTAMIDADGFRGTIVVDILGNHDLLPLETYELFRLTVEPLLPEGATAEVSFCNGTLGTPILDNIVVIGGQGITPLFLDGTLAVTAPIPFRRGDVNLDGNRNVADPIAILNALFVDPGGTDALGCLLAADANDDEGVNIADAVTLLNFLFVEGFTELPPPECGGDPTFGPLECRITANCP